MPLDGAATLDVRQDMPAGADTGADGGSTSVPDGANPNGAAQGQPCTSANQCKSGFCFDGVCCQTDCSGVCLTCASAGAVGTCVAADPGTDPRNECPDDGIASCGRDGACSGAGSCRLYPAGMTCQAQTCTGATLTQASRCDGQGACVPASGLPCTPYACGTDGTCLTTCTTDAQCSSGNVCTARSCGKAPAGATCGTNDDCFSGFCAQGVCCQTDCTGLCRSCAVPGSAGTCTNVPAGSSLGGQCAQSAASTCGTDGTCDGNGGCRKYVSGTVCTPPSCATATGTETLPGKCDGAGVCVAGGLQNCVPYVCGPNTAAGAVCLARCTTNADCAPNYLCTGGQCVKKLNGVTCTVADECVSGFCQQGVCCNTGCAAACQSCALTGTVGTCTSIGAGLDPLNQCDATDPTTCGTDGACDGNGHCRLFATGTQCIPSACSGFMLTTAGRCNGMGACLPGTNQTCAPFTCATTGGVCKATCTVDTDCTAGNVCTNGSCGLKPPGAACTVGTDCASGFCQQGVCCGTACTAACKSCALAGSAGTCSNIPDGQDPLNQCDPDPVMTCGKDGFCNGSGACRLYAPGTQCIGSTCSMAMLTSARTCDGSGTCRAATVSSCGAFQCDPGGLVCRATCSADADCVSPNTCIMGICTKKGLATTCTTGGECASGFCQQGVCCMSSCTGTCMSCALASNPGVCSNVAAGVTAAAGQCPAAAASTCGNDGTCDGLGHCRLFVPGTQCVGSSCSMATFIPARTCDGAGVCRTVTSQPCDPFQCDATGVCKTTCAIDGDCVSPNTCMMNKCGKKGQGVACTTGAECASGNCSQGVCCLTNCTGTCRSCALAASLGTCASIPAGQDPNNECAATAAMTCGTDGSCDGNGACRLFGNGTQCVGQMCSGSTLSSIRTCNGMGTCQAPTMSSCSPYLCNGTTACKTTCTSNADCLAPNVCIGVNCSAPTNLKVQYATRDLNATDQAIGPHYIIVNSGATAVPLSELTIKYWYTIDSNVAQTGFCDFAATNGNCTNVQFTNTTNPAFTAFGAVSPAKTGADSFYMIGFTAAAGSIPANSNTSQIQVRFNKNDFSNYNENNDYSYTATTAFIDAPHVTLYRLGTLVWGMEPP